MGDLNPQPRDKYTCVAVWSQVSRRGRVLCRTRQGDGRHPIQWTTKRKGRAVSQASSINSTVAEDILKLVWSAEEAGRDGVKPKDIADHMGVVPSTATENVQRLARQGLVVHERYGRVRLTDEGRAIALGMVRRHRLLETYLHEELGFSWDEVHEEAEILEHAVSQRLLDRLDRVLGYPRRDPHVPTGRARRYPASRWRTRRLASTRPLSAYRTATRVPCAPGSEAA